MKNAPWAAKEIELIERTPEEFKEGMEEWRRLKEFRDSKFEPGRQIPEALAWKTLYHYIDQKCELARNTAPKIALQASSRGYIAGRHANARDADRLSWRRTFGPKNAIWGGN